MALEMPMPRLRVLLLSTAWLLAPLGGWAAPDALAADPGTWTEPSSGQVFPLTVSPPGSAGELSLTGGGVRTKLVFKVYGFGFYIDAAAARERLAGWAGKPAASLAQDSALYDALIEMPVTKLAVMKFVRDLDGAQIGDALDDAVSRTVPEGDPARAAFRALWKDPIAKGDEASILFSPGGVVSVLRGTRTVGSVTSEPLSRALLLAWLGPEPVSDSIRKGAVERVPLLATGP